jgi:hypothetical protein
LPDWLAAISHIPALTSVILTPETEQSDVL